MASTTTADGSGESLGAEARRQISDRLLVHARQFEQRLNALESMLERYGSRQSAEAGQADRARAVIEAVHASRPLARAATAGWWLCPLAAHGAMTAILAWFAPSCWESVALAAGLGLLAVFMGRARAPEAPVWLALLILGIGAPLALLSGAREAMQALGIPNLAAPVLFGSGVLACAVAMLTAAGRARLPETLLVVALPIGQALALLEGSSG